MRSAIGMVVSLVLIPATGCHWVFPHHPAAGDAQLERRVEGGGERSDRREVAAPPNPCSVPENWKCTPIGIMPPKCALTCGNRTIACNQAGFSTCSCTIGTKPCGTSVSVMAIGSDCAKASSPCWTSLQNPALACCSQ